MSGFISRFWESQTPKTKRDCYHKSYTAIIVQHVLEAPEAASISPHHQKNRAPQLQVLRSGIMFSFIPTLVGLAFQEPSAPYVTQPLPEPEPASTGGRGDSGRVRENEIWLLSRAIAEEVG